VAILFYKEAIKLLSKLERNWEKGVISCWGILEVLKGGKWVEYKNEHGEDIHDIREYSYEIKVPDPDGDFGEILKFLGAKSGYKKADLEEHSKAFQKFQKESKKDEELKNKIYKEIDLIGKSFLKINENKDWKKVFINAPRSIKFNGKTIYQNAVEQTIAPQQVIIDVLIEQEGSVSGTYLSMTEDDNVITITHPLTMFASDGRIIPEDDKEYFPNPYANGTFTQVLGKYVREKKLLTLEDAIRRMTSYPAQKLGLQDRGLLREGYKADITIFDAERIIDKATYENPRLYSEGVEYVFINGELAINQGKFTGSLSGMPIKKND